MIKDSSNRKHNSKETGRSRFRVARFIKPVGRAVALVEKKRSKVYGLVAAKKTRNNKETKRTTANDATFDLRISSGVGLTYIWREPTIPKVCLSFVSSRWGERSPRNDLRNTSLSTN